MPTEVIEEGWECGNCMQLAFGQPTPYCAACSQPTKGPNVVPPTPKILHICTIPQTCPKTHLNVSGKAVHA